MYQFGWGDALFAGASQDGVGIGDDNHSWAYDGSRLHRWFKANRDWGKSWKPGSVVGCAADLDASTISFSLDGDWSPPMGVAFL